VVQIILLAMVALFVGLRLYAVLGRRTGHEQPIAKPVEAQPVTGAVVRAVDVKREQAPAAGEAVIEPRATDGVRAIVAADASFDVARFLDGARQAYKMVLEAFWRGDKDELGQLADDEVRDTFAAAIDARAAAGEVLDNRLVTIERATISAARLEGQMALVTVRFDADIAAVTRDRDGNVVAGSLTDAVPTHDVWTFSRHVRADDPNWVLIETDEAA
jgi:predicted lipid-binding transport protein (Tim44 family)